MSYINLNILKSKNLSLHELGVLQLCKQNRIEDLSEILEQEKETLNKLSENGYLEEIKGTKTQSQFQKIRASKKGVEALDLVSTPLVTENELKIFEWVKNIYKNLDKEVGNEKKCKIYIAQFSAESGISRNSLAFLIQTFLNDEKEMEYSQRLEYLFYKGASVFNVKFDLYQSRLFQYYKKQEEYFNAKFKTFE